MQQLIQTKQVSYLPRFRRAERRVVFASRNRVDIHGLGLFLTSQSSGARSESNPACQLSTCGHISAALRHRHTSQTMRPSSAPTDLALPPASRLAHAAPVQVPVPSTPSPTQSALVDIKRAQLASTNALERKLDVEEPRIQEVRGHVACCALGRRGQRGRRLGLRRTPEAGCGLTTLLDASGARGRLGQWSKISRGWEGGGCDSSAACCDLAWKSLSHVLEVSHAHV